MCRYLLAAPASDYDKKHQVRVLLGNGLKANIWQKFVDRFNIQGIVEFYGATEGNTNIGMILILLVILGIFILFFHTIDVFSVFCHYGYSRKRSRF
jgi:acyl-CoA synthetase (AMP-forming)/AMP-acid ligase II